MSRLDYVTIVIIVVCAAALAILVWKTISLRNKENNASQQNTENKLQDYNYDYYKDTTQVVPPTDEDADDSTVQVYDEHAKDNEPTPAEAKSTPKKEQPKATATTTTRSSTSGDYLVLAGSFSIKANAESEVQRLQKMGYPNAEVSPFNKGKYAVVLVDRFTDLNEAQALVKKLKGKGIDSYVQEKREE